MPFGVASSGTFMTKLGIPMGRNKLEAGLNPSVFLLVFIGTGIRMWVEMLVACNSVVDSAISLIAAIGVSAVLLSLLLGCRVLYRIVVAVKFSDFL